MFQGAYRLNISDHERGGGGERDKGAQGQRMQNRSGEDSRIREDTRGRESSQFFTRAYALTLERLILSLSLSLTPRCIRKNPTCRDRYPLPLALLHVRSNWTPPLTRRNVLSHWHSRVSRHQPAELYPTSLFTNAFPLRALYIIKTQKQRACLDLQSW